MTKSEINNLKEYLDKYSSSFEEYVINILIKHSDDYDNINDLLNNSLSLMNENASELIYNDEFVDIYTKYMDDIHSIISNSESNEVNIDTYSFGNCVLFNTYCVTRAWKTILLSIKSFLCIK